VSWLGLTPTFAVALGCFFAPGLLIARTLGLRGIFLWAAAPAVSVAITVGSALLGQLVGLRWNLVSAGLGTLLAMAAAIALTRLAPQLRGQDQLRPARGEASSMLVWLGVAAVVVSSRLVWAIGSPQAFSQTHDNLFHLNAVRYVVDTGRGSSLTLGWLGTQPGRHFYPGAWHDLVSLVVTSTGTSIPASINVTNIVIAAVVWPIGCMALAVSATGHRQFALASGALLATAFSVYPYFLFNFGVIYPWMLAVSVTPIILALIIAAVRSTQGTSRESAICVAIVAYGGLFLVHPSVAVLLLVLVGSLLFPSAIELTRSRHMVGLTCIAAYGLLTLVAWGLVRPPRTTNWDGVGQAGVGVLQSLLLAPPLGFGEISLVTTTILWIGVIVAILNKQLRWTLPLFFVVVAFEGLTQWSTHPTLKWILTGVWYSDPFRPATLLPVAAVPVMVVGLFKVWERYGSPIWRAQGYGAKFAIPLFLVGLAALLLDPGIPGTLRDIHRANAVSAQSALLTPSELALLERLPGQIPRGTVVAGNPATGSSLAYALEDVRVVEPFIGLPDGWAGKRVMDSLDSMTTDPSVCLAVRKLNVGYVLDFSGRRIDGYQPLGLRNLTRSRGFALIDQEGNSRLFKITGCQQSNL
jgi:hypothetical protein